MQATPSPRDSQTALMDSFHTLSSAGGSVIQIKTREPVRAALTLRKHLIGGGSPYREWDVVNGIRTQFTVENYADHKIAGTGADFMEALRAPLEDLRNAMSPLNANIEKVHYFVYVDPHPYINGNPVAVELIQQYAAILPTTNVCTIFVTDDNALQLPPGTVLVTELSTPTAEELEDKLKGLFKTSQADRDSAFKSIDIDAEGVKQIAHLGLGMTLYEFETHAAIAMIEASVAGADVLLLEHMLDGVGKGKTAVVKQSEILELTHSADIGDVGGMDLLKKWILARAECFSPEAEEFGIEPPKGMVLVGVPGTGKSLVAKVTASALGIPLVRLDFGRVFSKYVGDSESRVRAALKMVEEMSPVVLFVDEVDKGLGGSGGGGDSGTSSRVLGSFLTWLQECKKPVFTVVTANRVDGLPPELLRRGRFDKVFSVGMPSPQERREVLDIHLRKRDRDMSEFNEAEMAEFDLVSNDYVPAEIESAVKDAIIAAYGNKRAYVEMSYIVDAFKNMVPMSKSHKTTVDTIIAWARENASPVSSPAVAKPMQIATGAGQHRRIGR